MTIFENQSFDEERALYGSDGVLVRNCRFDGPADGESALKESQNIQIEQCFMNLRYQIGRASGRARGCGYV